MFKPIKKCLLYGLLPLVLTISGVGSAQAQSTSQGASFRVALSVPVQFSLTKPEDTRNPNIKYDKDLSINGFAFHFYAPQNFGMGINFMEQNLASVNINGESATPYNYQSNITALDLFYSLPITTHGYFTLGIGLGEATIGCADKLCKNTYSKLEVKKKTIQQVFAKIEIVFAGTFILQGGVHGLSTEAIELQNKGDESTARSIDPSGTVYTLGLGARF